MNTITILLLAFLPSYAFSQYLETFPLAEKGILVGGPTNTTGCPTNDPSSCLSIDFNGVDWMINGNFSLLDIDDYAKTTTAGVFEFGGDIDEEVCWESPLLDISSTASVTYTVDLTWSGQDNSDYMDVEYMTDLVGWTQVPNQFGGGTHTIDYTTSGNSGSATISQSGITGSTLSVRVCADTNTAVESTTIDNVSIPGASRFVLPVELIYFKAEKKENGVVLDWATASEINNEKFQIEESYDKETFIKLGEVEGQGTDYAINNYSFKTESLNKGISYYRLKQIDYNGQYTYSNIISVNHDTESRQTGTLYPNPATQGWANLEYNSISDNEVSISFFDMAGNVVSVETQSIYSGINLLSLDVSDLNHGLYIVEIKNGENQIHQKLVIGQ